MGRTRHATYFLGICSAGIALLMIIYPETAVRASFQGLQMWWENVFPALFPFFVLTELMIGFGVVTFAGVLLEPVMRPVFRVPGIGGFVFMMGLVSGYPAGARMTAQLYKEQKLTKSEAERLSSFTNFSNPLFLFSVTAVQFFHQASLGIVFALAHYFGNIGVGLIMRAYKPLPFQKKRTHSHFSLFARALRSMHSERMIRYEPLGKMLGDAVISSVRTLLVIGGFIMLFSMLYQLFRETGTVTWIGSITGPLFELAGLTPELGQALLPGIFEMTIGVHEVAVTGAPVLERVIVGSALLGFCGFSIQAQTVSILSQAGLSAKPFLIGRLIHAILSGIAAFLFYHMLHIGEKMTGPSAVPATAGSPVYSEIQLGPIMTASVLILFILILLKRMQSGRHQ
ncbi:sporulation integral membrane protein YlbJ [Sporolactobacillus sp. THM19-2]|uniref:sporulation integral membrane protein YlbJ n=1 Tax=Sporolactobacillus sp. THM19-2 TaxID=2511171 RepID=UPI001021FF52|nr:sporulation integral membrane protein YlbJ [Sporolactobacillus sp. THM19-2]RYL92860.1 sporulation integral membrane protein YlbJ [Sporolactobacillus sp. THM19-2]